VTNRNSNLEQLVAQLLSEHYDRLVRWAITKFGEYVAEDAVAFAFGQLALGRMPVDHAQPVAWLRLVAKREALTLLEVYNANKPSHIDSLDAIVSEPTSADDPALAAEQMAKLDLLHELTGDQREALELSATGLRYKEIALKLGWTYTKVNRSITEGRAKLRKLAEGGES
jgi:RNA polymerase sigma factor (sigma-70 family)